jgi:hypothetical protein
MADVHHNIAAALAAALMLVAASAAHADDIDDIQASNVAKEQLQNCIRSQRTAAWDVYNPPPEIPPNCVPRHIEACPPIGVHLMKDIAAVLARCEQPGQRAIICKPFLRLLVSGTSPAEFCNLMMVVAASEVIEHSK